MNDEKDVWESSKDATGREYREAASRGNSHDLPKGCWVLLGYSFALVLMVGGMLLLVTLVILAGGILLAIATTKSL